MYRLILKDLKSMFRKPAVFIVLLLGLTVGAFALSVYYTMNTHNQALQGLVVGENNIIEGTLYDSYDLDSLIAALERLESEDEYPAIYGCNVMGYSSADYDIIGEYFNGKARKLYKGYYLDKEDNADDVAVISHGLFENGINISDKVKVGRYDYTVKGVIEENGYLPFSYDMRRLAEGSEELAGKEMERPWADELRERPCECVIIPLNSFSEKGFTPSYFHLTFSENMSDDKISAVKDMLIYDYGLFDITDTSQLVEISNINSTSNTMVYFFAVFCGLLNIVVLFAFFLKENKKQYITYRMLGATNFKIAVIIVSELAIYTFISFCIGALCAYPFIEYSNFVGYHIKMKLWDYALLYVILLVLELIMCYGQIRSITGKSVVKTQNKNYRIKEEKSDEEISVSNKGIYLLSYQYNKKNIARTVSLCALSIIAAFCFSYSFTYVFESGKMQRYTDKVFPNDAAVILPHTYVYDEILEYGFSVDENGMRTGVENSPHLKNLQQNLNKYSQYVGTVSGIGAANINDENNTEILNVNSVFANNSPILLSEGSWIPLADYNKNDENAVIPCVVTPEVAKQYDMGSEFTASVSAKIGEIVTGEDSGEFIVEEQARTFKVVGIISENAYLLTCDDELSETVACTELFYENMDYLPYGIYAPDILYNGKAAIPIRQDYKNYYIFYDENNSLNDNELSEAISDFGIIRRFKPIVAESVEQFKNAGGNVYFIHAIITTALLMFGVGGYSIMQFASNKYTYGIYYSLGMTWQSTVALIVGSNALNMIIPAIFGSIAGVVASGGIRLFDTYTKIISALMGISVVLVIYLISSVFIIWMMSKEHPRNMLNQRENYV